MAAIAVDQASGNRGPADVAEEQLRATVSMLCELPEQEFSGVLAKYRKNGIPGLSAGEAVRIGQFFYDLSMIMKSTFSSPRR
jgi:hypothetical protein